mmetsp:Transcript_32151/g.58137  ORF Transcript_32151/g.58137 Transcript_32151/m.58137 type:complete len:203 (-) Transcript_32151:286-894(-)
MDIISTNLLLSIRNNTPVSSSQHLNAIEQITLDHRLHDPDAQQRHEDQCGHARYDLRCEDGIVGEFIVDWLGGSVEFDGHSSQIQNQCHAHTIKLPLRLPQHPKSRTRQHRQTDIGHYQIHKHGQRIESIQKCIEIQTDEREDVSPVQFERKAERRVLQCTRLEITVLGTIETLIHSSSTTTTVHQFHLVQQATLNLEHIPQ